MATPKKTPVSKLSFDQAVGEVEGIVARLENEQTDVDELAGEVQRAVELITACRERLQATDAEVRELVRQLAPEQPRATAAADLAAAGADPADAGAGAAATDPDRDPDQDVPF